MRTMKVFLGTIESVKNFVNAVTKLNCDVDIVSGRYIIDAKSIMGIFSLDLSKPVEVKVYAEGAVAEEAEKALQIFEVKQ